MSQENCQLIGDGQLHGAYIKNVDKSKPFGRMVENYADQKWWKGFWIGWTTGLAGVCLGCILNKFVLPKS